MIRHVIFDCDGVLVDSEPLSMRADVEILRRFGIVITEEEAHRRFVGTTFEAMLETMAAQTGVTFPTDLHDSKNHLVEDYYQRELQIVPGVKAVLAELAARNITCSIGTNSPKARVELALSLTGIAAQFQRITSYEDVARGKPAPDVFLHAAASAGIPLGQCLVVEDSVTGVTAAVAAGIKTIGFVGTHEAPVEHAVRLRAIGAFATVNKMDDIALYLV